MVASALTFVRRLRWRPLCEIRRARGVCVPAVHLHMTAATMQVGQKDFEKAQEQLKLLKKDPGNETKLKLYALFKQATEGPCNSPKPGMLDFVKKAKWDAWNSLGDLSQLKPQRWSRSYSVLTTRVVAAQTPRCSATCTAATQTPCAFMKRTTSQTYAASTATTPAPSAAAAQTPTISIANSPTTQSAATIPASALSAAATRTSTTQIRARNAAKTSIATVGAPESMLVQVAPVTKKKLLHPVFSVMNKEDPREGPRVAPSQESKAKDSARQKYTELVSSLVSAESAGQKKDVSSEEGRHDGYETILVTTKNNITKIMFNRPDKKNAINRKMYREIIKALEEAGKDDSTIAVITGNGDYYSSGNDLSNFTNVQPGGMEKMADDGAILLKEFVSHFIDFPKPLIAVVNGPAIGICVTVLGLCDLVYASDRATFHSPFSQLGQSPEGCSSYLFPKIMGLAKANEMLLFNKKLTAAEACAQGLVTEVFPDRSFQKEVWARLEAYASLPKNSLAVSKQLLRSLEKEKLHEVNSKECEVLKERWLSDECVNAIASFFQRRSKL